MASVSIARGVAISVAALVVVAAMAIPTPQDWLPFHIAAKLSATQRWHELYSAPNTTSLFDVSDAYRDQAFKNWNPPNPDSADLKFLTAFVSPPPAALFLRPFVNLKPSVSRSLWALSLAVPLAFALLLMTVEKERSGHQDFRRWAVCCGAAAPILVYTTAVGQSTAWLVTAAIVSVLRQTRLTAAVGGVALALAILTKASPVLLIPALWLAGRRQMAYVSSAIVVVSVASTWFLVTPAAWLQFVASVRHLGGVVVTGWPNASVDAFIVRFETYLPDGTFLEPNNLAGGVALLVRVALIAVAGWRILGGPTTTAQRIAAAWVLWLASTPLLWLHYLAVLVPVGAATSRRATADFSLFVTLALSTPLVWRIMAGGSWWQVQFLSAAWLISAVWLLRKSTWSVPVTRAALV